MIQQQLYLQQEKLKSKPRTDISTETYQTYRIHKAGCEVGFIWVPAHMGVEGNEEADYLAKNTADKDRVEIALQNGLSEYTSIINKSVKEMRQNT